MWNVFSLGRRRREAEATFPSKRFDFRQELLEQRRGSVRFAPAPHILQVKAALLHSQHVPGVVTVLPPAGAGEPAQFLDDHVLSGREPKGAALNFDALSSLE